MHWDHRVSRRLKLRELNILLAVAQAGSMAKAAKGLAISQPAVSRAIADMEHVLGVPLFDRSPQGIEPTRYGRALLKRGVAVFDELKQGVADIEFLADPTAGELRIGSSSGLSEGVVLAVINRLTRQYPRIVFHVVPTGALEVYDELRERRLELGFVRLSGRGVEGDLNEETLFEDPLVVVAGADQPAPWRGPPLPGRAAHGDRDPGGLAPPGPPAWVWTHRAPTPAPVRRRRPGRQTGGHPTGSVSCPCGP